jgi:hypothetical protein
MKARITGVSEASAISSPDRLSPTSPTTHYHVSLDSRHKVHLPTWLDQNEDDPALKVCYIMYITLVFANLFQDFIPRLKNHLLSRLLGFEYDGDELPFTAADRRCYASLSQTRGT